MITLSLIFILAFLVEAFTEYFVSQLFDKFPALSPHKWALVYVAAVFGVLLAVYYKTDVIYLIFSEIGGEISPSWVGYILTGLGIGRGANWLHEFVGKFVK